jgi:hypothetical protein
MFRAALSVFPRQNRPKLPHFEQLRDVAHLRRIGSIPRGRPKGANLLTPFFYLPEVHRVSACIDSTPSWRWPEHKPALETLTTLNIAFVHAKHLGTILSEKPFGGTGAVGHVLILLTATGSAWTR